MEPETAKNGYKEVFKCYVCKKRLKWRSMREHLQQFHPEVVLPNPMPKSDWHPTVESQEGQVQKTKCYVCLGKYAKKEHWAGKHPDTVLPDRMIRSEWPTEQDATVESPGQKAAAARVGPSEIPEMQSQSVDNNAFPIIQGINMDHQFPDDEQRDRISRQKWSALQDAAAESSERHAAVPGSEPSETPKQQSQSLHQTPEDKQLDLIDLVLEKVDRELVLDDFLSAMDTMSMDQTLGDEQDDCFDLVNSNTAAELMDDCSFPIGNEMNMDRAPDDEQGDRSDFSDWDAAAGAKRDDVLPTMDEMDMDPAPNDGQRACLEPDDEDITEATPDNVSPNMDGLDIHPDPDNEQRHDIDLIHGNAEK